MANHNELEIPEGVEAAEQAIEVFRAWIADGRLHVTFDPSTFSDRPSEWGRLLADAAQHIAHACALEGEDDPEIALKQIVAGFHQVIGSADAVSSTVTGRIKRGPVN